MGSETETSKPKTKIMQNALDPALQSSNALTPGADQTNDRMMLR